MWIHGFFFGDNNLSNLYALGYKASDVDEVYCTTYYGEKHIRIGNNSYIV